MVRLSLTSSMLAALIAVSLSGPSCGGSYTVAEGDGDGDGDGDVPGTGGSPTGAGGGAGGTDSGTGGAGDFDRSCTATIQCTLAQATCCGTCAEQTVDDVVAIRADEKQAYLDSLCPEDVACPACVTPQNPNLFAECVQGTCEVRDIRTHDEGSCTTPDDCVVIPAACCECGAGTSQFEIVAANSMANSFREYQCAEAATVLCDDCVWAPPQNASTSCDDGACTLTFD